MFLVSSKWPLDSFIVSFIRLHSLSVATSLRLETILARKIRSKKDQKILLFWPFSPNSRRQITVQIDTNLRFSMIRTLKGERRAKPSLHVLGQLKLDLSMHFPRLSVFRFQNLNFATSHYKHFKSINCVVWIAAKTSMNTNTANIFL